MAEKQGVDFVFNAQNAAGAVFRSVQSSIDGVSASYGKMTALLAGGTAIAAFAASMKSIIDTADEVNKASQKFGIAVEDLTSLRFAAKLADVEFGDLQTGLKKLAENSSLAAGGAKEQSAAFEAMGVAVKDAAGNVKQTDALLREIADKFAGYADGPTKAALAVELFGRSGVAMIPLLNNLREAEKEAKALGAVFGKDLAKASEDFNDNLTRMNALFNASKISLANNLLPTLNKFLEQMIEGTKIAGGFTNALALFGLSNIRSDNSGSKIREITDQIGALQAKLKDPGFVNLPGRRSSIESQIEDLKKQADFARYLQRQSALSLEGGDTPGERARLGLGRLPAAPIIPKVGSGSKGGTAAKEPEDKTFENLLRQYTEMAIKAEEVTEFERLTLLLQTERFEKLSKSQKDEVLNLAAKVDLQREGERVQKEADAEAQKFADDQVRKIREQEQALEALKQQYIDLADPTAKFVRQLAELDRLMDTFPELADVFAEAKLRIHESIDETLGLNRALKDTDDIARDLSHAVSTMFEDAILEAKGFEEVLTALGKTIAQIVIRQTVTKPLQEAIGGIVSSIFTPRASGGPVEAGRAYIVGEQGPEIALFGASGSIVPNNRIYGADSMGNESSSAPVFTFNQNYNIGSGVSRAEVVAAVEAGNHRTMDAFMESIRRDRTFARHVRGR
jgi:hypothetical protein